MEADDCRICSEPGQYDLFNDELAFDETNTRMSKIYIVLNNFLYEKLYAPDEYSSFICTSCCNNLCDSYTFMTLVRNSEQNLRNGQRVQQKSSQTSSPPLIDSITATMKIEQPYVEVAAEEPFDIIEDTSEIEEDIPTPDDESFHQIDEIIEEEPILKKPKPSMIGSPDSIIYTFYQLNQYCNEKNQSFISLNVTRRFQERPSEGNYVFDSSWINNSHSDAVYKCTHCIKAFANSEFLLKHLTSSHLCLICMEIVANYKDLNKHTKEKHSSIDCSICDKSCTSPSNYRHHLKKQHQLQLPAHIGILNNS